MRNGDLCIDRGGLGLSTANAGERLLEAIEPRRRLVDDNDERCR